MAKNIVISSDKDIVKQLIKLKKLKDVPAKFKIDWLSFTVAEERDFKDGKEFYLLDKLGYDVSKFDEVAGRNFFNSGVSFKGAVKVFYNDPSKKKQKGAIDARDYIFTGVGCSDLQGHVKNDWISLFFYLRDFGVKFSRIDICMDDLCYPSKITFPFVERKLARKHFRSSKRRYNLMKDVNTAGKLVGETCYFGSRSTTGKNGHVLCRAYQKALQMVHVKHQEDAMPVEVRNQIFMPDFDEKGYQWIRWELEFTKHKAVAMIDLILELSKTESNPIAEAYYRVLRDTIDFLVPTKGKDGKIYKNKARWKSSPKWLSFLQNSRKAILENPSSIYDLGSVHDWILYQVMPTVQMLQEIYEARGLDFYDLMRATPKFDFSKKQEVLLETTKDMTVDQLVVFANRFLEARGDSDED